MMTKKEFRAEQEKIRDEYYKEIDRLQSLRKEEEAPFREVYENASKTFCESVKPIRERYSGYTAELERTRKIKLAKLTRDYGETERAIRFLVAKGYKIIAEEEAATSRENIDPTTTKGGF